ncbi:MAG: hypothetical protein ACJA19_000524 [Bacteroidia bacterium]|jgi:hypothetical protein|tara:strand:+ start:973 stop:1113 length:141 start_codon:yes stop_codon:yes gene_type:complete
MEDIPRLFIIHDKLVALFLGFCVGLKLLPKKNIFTREKDLFYFKNT